MEVLSRCHDDEVRAAATTALHVLEMMTSGSDVADNLRAEELLTCEFWGVLIRRFGKSGNDETTVCSTIREYIREVGTLKGPQASVKTATILGRVVTRQQLADVFAINRYFANPAEALKHIRSVEKKPLQYFQRAWGDYDLGRHVMWSTFNAGGGPPFEALPKNADQIRGRLGLDSRDSGRPLLLLQYVLPGADARIATIAEAYAGDTWHRFFKTASEAQILIGYGMTHPWPSIGGTGLPEVVHGPVKGRFLVVKPEVVL